MRKLESCVSLICGFVLIVHGGFTALQSNPEMPIKPIVQNVKYVHDTITTPLVFISDTVFSVKKEIKIIPRLQEIDSELVYSAYLRSFILKKHHAISIKTGVANDSLQ